MTTAQRSGELVSLAHRIRTMQLFRATVAAVVLTLAAVLPQSIGAGPAELAPATSAYLAIAAIAFVAGRVRPASSRALFTSLLLVDGVYLAWMAYLTGGLTSPLRHLVLVHLVAVTLLASYRTGLKLALWHSLLVIVTYNAVVSGLLPATDAQVVGLPGTAFHRLVLFVGMFWVVAVGTATFSAVNERELRRRRVDLEALAALATDLDEAADARHAGQVLIDHVRGTFGVDRAVVVGGSDGAFHLLAGGSVSSLDPHEDRLVAEVVTGRTTVLVSRPDPEHDPWLSRTLPGAANLILTPLVAEGMVVGVLVVEHGARSGSRVERRVVTVVERFAAHAALALRNAWLVEQLRCIAATDGLTQIANRRTFEETLERELGRARREGEAVGLVLIDIDHFKLLNDTHGHQTGDDVLREVATVLTSTSRSFDTAARYGGEEFAVILPGAGLQEAEEIAERLRRDLAEASTPVPITVSAGVSSYPVNARKATDLVRTADEALYVSKRAGRDRVTASKRRARPARDLAPVPGQAVAS